MSGLAPEIERTPITPGRLHEPDVPAILEVLRRWIDARLPAEPRSWARAAIDDAATEPTDARLFRAFGECVRRCGTADLLLTASEFREADTARPGWSPVDWTIDQAVRLAMLLATATAPAPGPDAFAQRLDMLIRTADVRELVTLHRGWPLYPGAAEHAPRAALGCRSNITPVFEAVAHHDPFPAEAFAEGPWNQMVLKALFVGTTLDPIMGLDARANPRLTAMLRQYAGERRAAGRAVSPELWRCVGNAPDAGTLDDLASVLEVGGDAERRAAILALRAIDTDEAASARSRTPELDAEAGDGAWGWSDLTGR